jgi:hypothetical protein
MKPILLLLALVVSVSAAETNYVKVFTTNYVADASNLREVDGQLYDILRSQKWQSVRCKYQNQSGAFAIFQTINRVKIGERPHEQSLNSMGLFTGPASLPPDYNIYEDQDGQFILLKNFPRTNFVTGQELSPRLLRVSQTNYNGAVAAIYDCGTPHMVPVVTFKTVKAP